MAKEYVLTAGIFHRLEGKGDDQKLVAYHQGDHLELGDEEAERLKNAVEEPGASQKAEADRLQAQIDALNAEREAIEAKVDETEEQAERVAAGEPATADDLDGLTLKELQPIAEAEGVEFDSKTRKAELLDRIRAHRDES